MFSTVPSQDTAEIERLLTELVNRMDGLLDTGTSWILAAILPDSRAFIDDHVGVLRSLAVVLRALLPGSADEGRADPLDQLLSACEQFRYVLTQLTVPPSPGMDRPTLVKDLREAVSNIMMPTAAIARKRGIVLSPLGERTTYRERIFQNLEAFLGGNGSAVSRPVSQS